MLNFRHIREKTLPQNLTLKHLLVFASLVGISLVVCYVAYTLSGSFPFGIILFTLTLLSLSAASLFMSRFLDGLPSTQADTKNILLLSHDDELAGQLRYLLPHNSTLLNWVRTYDSAMSVLSKKSTYMFIIDTDNKPKNTATLVELCRSHEHKAHRLPIIAIQKDATTEKKCQLLLEGFDDCLPKPVKQRDIDDFYRRWINTSEGESLSDTPDKAVESKTTHTPDTETPLTEQQDTAQAASPTPREDITMVVDKKQALVQSHQSPALAKDMLAMLIEMIEENKAIMSQLYQDQNWEALGEITHKIKGGCYCTGVPDLEKAMEAIDKALEKNQLDQLNQQFESMMVEIDHLLQWDSENDLDAVFA